MLKALWQKTLGHPSLASSAANRERGKFSLSSHMTHTGEFHLERLMELVTKRYEQTFDKQSDEAIRELIRFASRIQDQDIQRELLLFYLNCSPAVQEYLRSGEVLSNDHFISRAPGTPPSRK